MSPFAQSQKWPLVQEIHEDSEQGIDAQLGWQVSDDTALHYIEDATSGIGYLVVTRQDKLAADQVVARVVESLSPWGLDELFEAFDNSEGVPRAQGALRIGLAAPPEFNQDVFTRINSALSDDDPQTRLAGLWATTYTDCPEFLPKIRDVARTEKEDWVRERAESVLQAFESEDDQ